MKGVTKRTPATVVEALEWWQERAPKYPYHAMAPTSIKPTTVIGNHISIGVFPRTGWRLWGFKTQSERDMFCTQYGAHKA